MEMRQCADTQSVGFNPECTCAICQGGKNHIFFKAMFVCEECLGYIKAIGV